MLLHAQIEDKISLAGVISIINITDTTRITYAYDASRHSKRPAALMGHAALVSGVARLVGVQRTVQRMIT